MSAQINIAEDGRFHFDSGAARFLMDTPEYARFTLETGNGMKAVSLFAQTGDFPESVALPGRRRPHASEDGFEVALEAESPIPFGSKPVVERQFRFDGNALSVAVRFRLSASAPLDSIDAGGLLFSGKIARVAVTPFPADSTVIPAEEWRELAAIPDGTILYDSPAPPLRVRLAGTGKNGILELETGTVFWRWENAAHLSGTSRYTLTRQGDTILCSWKLYSFVPAPAGDGEIPPPPRGRDWNLSFRLLYRDPETGKTPYRDVFDVAAYPWPESALAVDPDGKKTASVCFASDAAITILKKWVRRHFAEARERSGEENPAVFAIINASSGHCCHSAAHMHRAKRGMLRHWDAPALAEFARWADRQLARNGARLEIVP